jgi:hypothetical protein
LKAASHDAAFFIGKMHEEEMVDTMNSPRVLRAFPCAVCPTFLKQKNNAASHRREILSLNNVEKTRLEPVFFLLHKSEMI